MRCEADHADGGVCHEPLVRGRCTFPERHASLEVSTLAQIDGRDPHVVTPDTLAAIISGLEGLADI